MPVVCADCGHAHPATATFGCVACGGALTVAYDAVPDRETIEAGDTLFEKYGGHLPSAGSAAGDEGGTPLLRADALAADLAIDATVYLKDERRNPTGSFKDRALAPVVSLAAENGETAVLTASSGNAAAACARYAARADIDCYLLVDDDAPAHKLVEPLAYGAEAVRVADLFAGGEAALADLLGGLADRLDAYLAFAYRPFNPVAMEGVRTVSYEAAEALDWTAPDVVVTATGGGDNLAAQYRGYAELLEADLVDDVPRMVAAQAAGAAPVVRGLEAGAHEPATIDEPDTVASGIGAPFAGRHAIDAIRESGGTGVAVSDEALVAAVTRLARVQGVWPEPSSATVVPALERLAEQGEVGPDDTVVLTITGSGYKHTEPVDPALPEVASVERDVGEVEEAFGG